MEHFVVVVPERLPTIALTLRRALTSDTVAWVCTDNTAPVVGLTIWPVGESGAPCVRRVPSERVAGLLDRPGTIRCRRSRGPRRQAADGPETELHDLFRALETCHLLWVPVAEDPVRGWLLARAAEAFGEWDVDIADLLVQGIRAATLATVSVHAPRTRSGESRPALPAELTGMPALTARERQMLQLVGSGLTASAIGHRTGISARTVQKHLQNVYAKLGCGDRLSAVLKIQSLEPEWFRSHGAPAAT